MHDTILSWRRLTRTPSMAGKRARISSQKALMAQVMLVKSRGNQARPSVELSNLESDIVTESAIGETHRKYQFRWKERNLEAQLGLESCHGQTKLKRMQNWQSEPQFGTILTYQRSLMLGSNSIMLLREYMVRFLFVKLKHMTLVLKYCIGKMLLFVMCLGTSLFFCVEWFYTKDVG